MNTSIIITTRNRCSQLKQTLISLEAVSRSTVTSHEVIIVDNGSTDKTYELASRFPQFKFFHEARPGKSIACNYGVSKSSGVNLLFTDDDVRFPDHWIDRMVAPLQSGQADAVQGGVRIAPHLERPWLKGMLRAWVAEVSEAPPVGLVGANMAILRSAYLRVGGLDERLGPGASGFYDDTKLGLAIAHITHLPECAVEHHFDESRLTFGSFLKISRAMAKSAKITGFHTTPLAPSSWIKLAMAFAGVPVNHWESFFYWHNQIERARAEKSAPANSEECQQISNAIHHDLFAN